MKWLEAKLDLILLISSIFSYEWTFIIVALAPSNFYSSFPYKDYAVFDSIFPTGDGLNLFDLYCGGEVAPPPYNIVYCYILFIEVYSAIFFLPSSMLLLFSY